VAARRLRSGLRVYGDLLREDVSARLRPELSWYAGALSPVRDLDVFAASLSAPADDDARRLADALGPWLRRERDAAFAAAVEQLATARASVLRAQLVSVAREPSFTKLASRRATTVLAPRVLHADHRSFRMLAGLSAGDPGELWHAARITAKRARYAAEVGAPALGHACRDLAYVWADITDPLGEAQDAVIQRALVLERVSDPSLPLTAAEAFACGVFVEYTREREIAEHQRAHRVWDDVRGRHKRLRRALAR
jgi:CHAD domain-containing protein